MRARIDVSEIEARTKIRAKYLRALENEEWDLLPDPTFTRSFLRTYAQALGLDGKALVEEYRLRNEPPSELEHQPIVSASRRARNRQSSPRGPGTGPSRTYVIALAAVSAVIVLLLVALLSGGGSPTPTKTTSSSSQLKGGHHHRGGHTTATSRNARAHTVVSLSLSPTAPVYVCLIADGTRKAIPGIVIEPPYKPVTYHAGHFDITLGNNAVTMYVDGKAISVPPSTRAIGYSITRAGAQPLEPGTLPTCA